MKRSKTGKRITPQEAKSQMDEILKDKNKSSRHATMDELMVEILRQFGFGDAMDVFESSEKWYE